MAVDVPAFAAVVHPDQGDVDALVSRFAHSLQQRGWRVRGLVQMHAGCAEGCAPNIELMDLVGSGRYSISQDLGRGSESCAIDAGRLAAAGGVLRHALDDGVDLAIANRFGKLEADGEGLTSEILALLSEGVPVLTIVSDKHLERLREFGGDMLTLLEPRIEALEAWFASLGLKREAESTP